MVGPVCVLLSRAAVPRARDEPSRTHPEQRRASRWPHPPARAAARPTNALMSSPANLATGCIMPSIIRVPWSPPSSAKLQLDCEMRDTRAAADLRPGECSGVPRTAAVCDVICLTYERRRQYVRAPPRMQIHVHVGLGRRELKGAHLLFPQLSSFRRLAVAVPEARSKHLPWTLPGPLPGPRLPEAAPPLWSGHSTAGGAAPLAYSAVLVPVESNRPG